MTHCTIDQLTDHLLGGAKRPDQAVSGHLASGCPRCATLLATLTRVREVGRTDLARQPPAGAVLRAKALCGPARAGGARRVEMRSSYDSSLSPGGSGTRGLHNSSRHLVFYSQDFALDLRMESEGSVRDLVVVGQLLNRDWGPLADVPVLLLCGDQVVSQSTTGHLGEFQLEGRPVGSVHLHLIVNDEELIEVDLDQRLQGELRPIRAAADGCSEPGDEAASNPTADSDSTG